MGIWEKFGAHGDLHAVFEADPPQELVDEMEDVDEVLASDNWDGEDHLSALRRRRGSKSGTSVASGYRNRHQSRANGHRRRSTREDDASSTESIRNVEA